MKEGNQKQSLSTSQQLEPEIQDVPEVEKSSKSSGPNILLKKEKIKEKKTKL